MSHTGSVIIPAVELHKEEPDVYQAEDDVGKAVEKIGLGGATVARWHANIAVTQVDDQWT